jgi:hypothetical protein
VNLTDLRDVLDERSTTDHAEARAHVILDGVHGRLAIRRRRRQVIATSAAVVAVLAVGAGALAVTRSAGRTPTPAASAAVPTINGFPEYAQGARVIAASPPLARAATSVRLAFVPSTTGLVFFVRCDGSDKGYEVSLNGRLMMSGSGCGTSGTPDPAAVRSYGVQVGKPSTVTVTFPSDPPANFAVAVGEKVDVTRYVFPARPSALQPLDLETGNMKIGDDRGIEYRTTKLVHADPAYPNRPVDLTFPWGTGVHLMLLSQTPGALTVSINGAAIAHGEWWDYGQTLTDGGTDRDWSPTPPDRNGWPRPQRGAGTTLTVKPERMTGDWAVAIQEPS